MLSPCGLGSGRFSTVLGEIGLQVLCDNGHKALCPMSQSFAEHYMYARICVARHRAYEPYARCQVSQGRGRESERKPSERESVSVCVCVCV